MHAQQACARNLAERKIASATHLDHIPQYAISYAGTTGRVEMQPYTGPVVVNNAAGALRVGIPRPPEHVGHCIVLAIIALTGVVQVVNKGVIECRIPWRARVDKAACLTCMHESACACAWACACACACACAREGEREREREREGRYNKSLLSLMHARLW